MTIIIIQSNSLVTGLCIFTRQGLRQRRKMPKCCLCMSSGKCIRCICVRAGRSCSDCGPSKCDPPKCENMITQRRTAINSNDKSNWISITPETNVPSQNMNNDPIADSNFSADNIRRHAIRSGGSDRYDDRSETERDTNHPR